MLQKFNVNSEGRDFVVGDVHGCFSLLRKLLKSVEFDAAKDRLFSVGDLVDRGPDSEEVADWLAQPWFHAVRGNHEDFIVNGMTDQYTHALNGGIWWLARTETEKAEIRQAVEQMPLAIEVETDHGRIGIVHAEVPDDNWLSFTEDNPAYTKDMIENMCLWSRAIIRERAPSYHKGPMKFNGVANIDHVYVGHTPVEEPRTIQNVTYIDTGAVFERFLTVICIQGEGYGNRYSIPNEQGQ